MKHIFFKLALFGALLGVYQIQASQPPQTAPSQKTTVYSQLFEAVKRNDAHEVSKILKEHPLLKYQFAQKYALTNEMSSLDAVKGHNDKFQVMAIVLKLYVDSKLQKKSAQNKNETLHLKTSKK